MTNYRPVGHVPDRAELREGQLVSLVTVVLGVTVMRWSSHPVVVPQLDGSALPFPGGIDGRDHQRLLALFTDSAGETEASFTDLPDLYGIGRLISSGAVLGAAVAEYSLWSVGTIHEDRDVFVNGNLSSPQYGGERDPIAFSIIERAEENSAVWPPATFRMTEAGMAAFLGPAEFPEESAGLSYPTILGTFHPSNEVPVSRAIQVSWDGKKEKLTETVLVAGGHVGSTSVLILPSDGTGGIPDTLPEEFTVVPTVDAFGQRISVVDLTTTLQGAPFTGATQFLVAWPDPGGGTVANAPYYEDTFQTAAAPVPSDNTREFTLDTVTVANFRLGPAEFLDQNTFRATSITISEFTSPTTFVVILHTLGSLPQDDDTVRQERQTAGTLRGAGDVFIWILERTNLRWNRGRWEAARAFLNSVRVGCVIEEDVDLWEYARQQLVPLFPMSIAAGPKGIEPVVWRYDATASEAIAVIRRGPGVWRSSPVQYMGDKSDIRNRFVADYAVSNLSDEAQASLVLDGGLTRLYETETSRNPAALLDSDLFFSINAALAKSQSIHGVRRAQFTFDVLHQASDVLKALSWRCVADGFLHRRVTYTVGKEFGYLRAGDVVRLTDDELGEVDRVALVAGVTRGDAEWMSVQLQIVTNPATSIRTTGPNPDRGDLPPPE